MTYTPPIVAPPAASPWDVAAITSGALDVLRLEAGDPDEERVTEAALEATALVDATLDYATPGWASSSTIPAPVIGAAVSLTVELFRRKDAPFGVADSWSVDGALVRLSSDVMKGARGLLAPYISRRGVA